MFAWVYICLSVSTMLTRDAILSSYKHSRFFCRPNCTKPLFLDHLSLRSSYQADADAVRENEPFAFLLPPKLHFPEVNPDHLSLRNPRSRPEVCVCIHINLGIIPLFEPQRNPLRDGTFARPTNWNQCPSIIQCAPHLITTSIPQSHPTDKLPLCGRNLHWDQKEKVRKLIRQWKSLERRKQKRRFLMTSSMQKAQALLIIAAGMRKDE